MRNTTSRRVFFLPSTYRISIDIEKKKKNRYQIKKNRTAGWWKSKILIFPKRMTLKEGRSLRPDHFHAGKAVRRRPPEPSAAGGRGCVKYACGWRSWILAAAAPGIRANYHTGRSPPHSPASGRRDDRARPCPFNVYAEFRSRSPRCIFVQV